MSHGEQVLLCLPFQPRSKKLSGAVRPSVGQRSMATATANSFPADLKIFSLNVIPNLSLLCNLILIFILVSMFTVLLLYPLPDDLNTLKNTKSQLDYVAHSHSLSGYLFGLES